MIETPQNIALSSPCPFCHEDLSELSQDGRNNHAQQCMGKPKQQKSPKKKPEPPTIEELEAKGLAPWKTAGDITAYPGETTIYERLRQFFVDYLCFDDTRYYDVVTSWTLHTWTIKNWRASGPLCPVGPVSSGKTTILECLAEVAYRGVRGGSMSNATMFRLSHAFSPTLLIDESQLYNREEWIETQAFLNERYRKGGRVWRMEGEGTQMLPRFFEAYGATALAGSSPPWEAMYNRALILQMSKGQPKKQTLTPEFYREGEELRALLKAYSVRVDDEATETELDQLVNMRQPEKYRTDDFLNPFPDPNPDAEEIKDYRVREVGIPLLFRSPIGGPRENVLSYLKDLESKHDAADRTSYLADYVIALEQCDHSTGKVSANDVRLQLALQWGLKIDGKDLPKSRTVMTALRTLGFNETRISDGKTGIFWDETLMIRLRQRFASPLPVTASVSSVSPEREGKQASQTEATEATEDVWTPTSAESTLTFNGNRIDMILFRDYIVRSAIPAEVTRLGYASTQKIEYACTIRFGEEARPLVLPELTLLLEEKEIRPGPFKDTWTK